MHARLRRPDQGEAAELPTPASAAFIEALAETAGVEKIDDYNGESQEGVSVFQQNASGGLRYSSSVGYLDHHRLPNLTITTRALITRILIEKGRATGVEVATATTGPARSRPAAR